MSDNSNEKVIAFKYKEQCEGMDLFLTIPEDGLISFGFITSLDLVVCDPKETSTQNFQELLNLLHKEIHTQKLKFFNETAEELFDQGIEVHMMDASDLKVKPPFV